MTNSLSGQPESAEPEGFSNLKKVNNILEESNSILGKKILQKKNELNSSSHTKKIKELNCEIEFLKLEEKEVLKFIVEVTSEDIEATEEYNENWKKENGKKN
ncbi:hypothetical protein H8356DRAFT_1326431 [Neocallimastix lanati (nom. inval.)]|nr:hypothetical protein H8356DRAFT_1326431 [Neocallimastix sp. JGI-2020a]